ncbi:MAG TPA: hypothetical protein VGK35_02000 [Actinotalea sp.]|jgi:hypothetical protein
MILVAQQSILAAATPPPTTVDPTTVTPGVVGFLVIFAVVLACIPLFRSMVGKLRGVERRARDEGTVRQDGDDLP